MKSLARGVRCGWLALSLLLTVAAPALATQDDSIPASDYVQQQGEQFFLLADASFASDERAQVRLEAPGRDYRRYIMEGYGGADVRVYRVPKPLDFLQKQKNLHRLQTTPNFRGEGLSNTLAYLWDAWYRQSRRAMQKAFSYAARKTVLEEAPALRMGEGIRAPTTFSPQPQFAPIAGLELVDQFRYPLWESKPIAPPAGVQLEGSSSEFTTPMDGNVYIPIGTLKPGLYIVEALIGNYRATTAVFVSDTVAITKIAGEELLVWTADKHAGTAVRRAEVLWTDGVGVLTRGQTDGDGILRLSHASPERSYVLGEDAQGGVFVSENFYYDSEIYNSKLYAFTDRPLYRPGDWVEVKILGREFLNARDSQPIKAAPIALTVIDANGTALQTLNLDMRADSGVATRFQLPANASAGGYELRFTYQDQLYSSAFRVAEYIKPHFEIVMDLDHAEYRTGQAVVGELTLIYPDGKPVAGANVEISLRAQQLSMVDNELQYLGQFPVELTTAKLKSDANGKVPLALPAAEKPSRYLLSVFASDGAAFRVRTSKEILIERGAAQYRLLGERRFSAAGDAVKFRYALEGQGTQRPVSYTWLRLEDRSTGGDVLSMDASDFELSFAQPGSYHLTLLDADGLILGGSAHAVSGDGVKASAGSIEIVLDQAEYAPGDIAEALITFPEVVAEALLTLERDRVEATALLGDGGRWLKLKRVGENQFRARIPVADHFAPNLTFSVLYTRNGDYSFQNAGIRVRAPAIEVGITTDREIYKPGDTVTVDLSTQLSGAPLSARLTVSVVDEMIYALQPEIAPAIGDFFYHPRRNNVRTSASLSFISYDLALPGVLGAPRATERSERGVKVLERPRREDVDTAAWQPDLVTDAKGHARFQFRMPDSLTRWRITARAVAADGTVGQRQAFLRSQLPLYLKWSGPTHFRSGDRPSLGVLVFNQGDSASQAELLTRSDGQEFATPVSLPRGVSYLPIAPGINIDGDVDFSLRQGAQTVDALRVRLYADAADWMQTHSESIVINGLTTPLDLPADARNLRVRLANGHSQLVRAALDDLLEYPWGCVEQTASRLLPLSLAFGELQAADARVRDRLRLILQNSRLRLVQMAGPNARFSWWDAGAEDAFLTAYAYYADFHASRALKLSMPDDHWQRVLEIYAERSAQTPLLQRALILDFAHEMRLPVQSLLQALATDLADLPAVAQSKDADSATASLVFNAPDSDLGLAIARLLVADVATAAKVSLTGAFHARLPAALTRVSTSRAPLAQALVLRTRGADSAQIEALFAQLAPEHATLERALILTWLAQPLAMPNALLPTPTPIDTNGWRALETPNGDTRWFWQTAANPSALVLKSSAPAGTRALISFDSAIAPKSTVPVTLTRRLWRLVPGEGEFAFNAEAVAPGAVLSSSTLYLDEITLVGGAQKPLRYGLVEVPLPPGADVERTTWGISVSGLGGTESAALEKARHESGELRYGVPIDTLAGELSFRHLVRFSQKGQFRLPPARYQRMYAPEEQAFEVTPALGEIEVR